jgi:F0F1-type ATP synthase gamma subunit
LGIEIYPLSEDKNSVEIAIANKQKFSTLADQFSEKFKLKLDEWTKKINTLTSQNKKIVIWGGGSKGVTFMNMLGKNNPIEYVVDINPRKEGMYTAGTGQKYVMPSFLENYKPDAVVIMNSIYESEIKATLQSFDINAEILTA